MDIYINWAAKPVWRCLKIPCFLDFSFFPVLAMVMAKEEPWFAEEDGAKSSGQGRARAGGGRECGTPAVRPVALVAHATVIAVASLSCFSCFLFSYSTFSLSPILFRASFKSLVFWATSFCCFCSFPWQVSLSLYSLSLLFKQASHLASDLAACSSLTFSLLSLSFPLPPHSSLFSCCSPSLSPVFLLLFSPCLQRFPHASLLLTSALAFSSPWWTETCEVQLLLLHVHLYLHLQGLITFTTNTAASGLWTIR